MTSYKIHSLKDSEKLSFIIEWETEKSVSEKLSNEGHIILSVEKIDIPVENLFCFEWKKSDGAFIEGKISADDIFSAYQILKNDYKYSLTKLYPQTVIEKEKQEKIFLDLIATFQISTAKKKPPAVDTSKQTLSKYRIILSSLIEILEHNDAEPREVSDLVKLEQNNNTTLIQEGIKNTLKNLSKKRTNSVLFNQIKPLMKDMNMYVLPDILFSIFSSIVSIFTTINPIFHQSKRATNSHQHNTISWDNLANEYLSIQNNPHIHIFLRKKYRPHLSYAINKTTKKSFFYTLYRQKSILLLTKESLHTLQKFSQLVILVTIFWAFFAVFLWLYSTIFVSTNTLLIFLILLSGSLVIQNETV